MIRRKHKPSKEELESLFEKYGSYPRIARELGVSPPTVYSWLEEEGIKTQKSSSREKMPSKDELKKLYNKYRSTTRIAKEFGVCPVTPYRWLIKYGIEVQKSPKEISNEKKPSKEELLVLIEKYPSANRIAKELKINPGAVRNWFREYGIEKKSIKQITLEKKPSKEELEAKCKEFGYNTVRVGKYYEVSTSAAGRWMKEYEIKNKKSNIEISKEKKPSKEELEKLIEKHGSYKIIAKELGVDNSTISYWSKEYGIISPNQRQRWNEEKVLMELRKLTEKLGYFPTDFRLKKGIKMAIFRNGGVNKFRKLLGFEEIKKVNGFYKNMTKEEWFNYGKVRGYDKLGRTELKIKDYSYLIKGRKEGWLNRLIQKSHNNTLESAVQDYLGGAK